MPHLVSQDPFPASTAPADTHRPISSTACLPLQLLPTPPSTAHKHLLPTPSPSPLLSSASPSLSASTGNTRRMLGNSKSCHNCRRRRLRCDRSWPGCHKCAVSGQECLGYGKVFVWTQAIDARGHCFPSPGFRTPFRGSPDATAHHALLGSSGSFEVTGYFPPLSDYIATTPTTTTTTTTAAATTTTPTANSNTAFKIAEKIEDRDHNGTSSSDARNNSGLIGGVHSQLTNAGSSERDYFEAFARSASSDKRRDASAVENQPQKPPSAYASLTDPLFQDLDHNSRHYLAHYLVARDAPGANPFRELIPLTCRHPLLLQILIATSAIHWSNIFRPITAVPTGLTDPGGYLAELRSKDLVSRQALIDALTAKEKAMGHLQEMLNTLDPAGSEVALAATHFFIKFDLIDLDKREGKSWRAHLQGSSSILALLTSRPKGKDSSVMLRDWVIADCFVYHILGSTLASGKLAENIARHTRELMPVLKRVEVNSYLSCPPEIFHIIFKASQLSYETPCTDWSLSSAEEALTLIDEALAFDIQGWADTLREKHNASDIDSRIRIASAHRSAVCLYITQALPLVRSVRSIDTESLVSDILENLGQISEVDPYFKATSWPTFIAGAETRDAEKRTSTMKRLLGIWEICPWGYIFTAIEMLKATWDMQDVSRRTNGESPFNWLRELRGMGYDYLIV